MPFTNKILTIEEFNEQRDMIERVKKMEQGGEK